jgi:D-tyrosyl-tRNA(Tyr) deacylase
VKAVVQRVVRAGVTVEGRQVALIGRGLLTLLGAEKGDTPATAGKIIEKISKLRIFEDPSGKMNLSLQDIQGEHLLVSQFTLLADCTKGNRPSFLGAGDPAEARSLFDAALRKSAELGLATQSGVFGADMQVELVNDGPATFVMELSE